MSKKNNAQNLSGCLIAIVRCLICVPLWYYLLYSILDTIGATTPMWVAYWVYVPSNVALAAVQIFMDTVLED